MLALRSSVDHRKIRLDGRPLLIAEPEIVRHESTPPDELKSRQDVQFNWVQTLRRATGRHPSMISTPRKLPTRNLSPAIAQFNFAFLSLTLPPLRAMNDAVAAPLLSITIKSLSWRFNPDAEKFTAPVRSNRPSKAALLRVNSRREFPVFLPFAKSSDQLRRAGTIFLVALPSVGNLSRNTQFMHARLCCPNLFGDLKSMVTPRHVLH